MSAQTPPTAKADVYHILYGPAAALRVADALSGIFRDMKAASTDTEVEQCLKLWRGAAGIGYLETLAVFAEANSLDSTHLLRAFQNPSVQHFMEAELLVDRIISKCKTQVLRNDEPARAESAAMRKAALASAKYRAEAAGGNDPLAEVIPPLPVLDDPRDEVQAPAPTDAKPVSAAEKKELTDWLAGQNICISRVEIPPHLLPAWQDAIGGNVKVPALPPGQLAAPAMEAPPEYVTLDKIAALVSRSKRTLEKLKTRKSNPLPDPDVQGAGGRPSEWEYQKIRPWLEQEYARKLPERFPAGRFQDARADRS